MELTRSESIQKAKRYLGRRDPVLRDVMRRVGEFSLTIEAGGYEVLVRAIISQQISTAAAKTIRQRLEDLLPKKKISPESINKLCDDQLIQAGISAQKRGYLKDLTLKTLDGTLNFDRIAAADDETAIEELITVRGVGRWTAQMYLLFSLGRPDVFALDDLGLKNACRRLYGLSDQYSRLELEKLAERWAPWRSVASWYLWRAADQGLLSEKRE